MAVCNATSLLRDGLQFKELHGASLLSVRIQLLANYLLRLNPSVNVSPSSLLAAGKCFACLEPEQLRTAKLELMCRILTALNGESTPTPPDCVCTSPVITSATYGPASPPYDLTMNWTFDHGNCPIAVFEIWKQINGGGFTLKATESSAVNSYFESNIGSTGQTIDYKIRYVNGSTVCDFSNTVSLPLFPS